MRVPPAAPRFRIEHDLLQLTGIARSPLAVGALQDRCTAAAAHVATAQAQTTHLPIFFGIEHLAALQEWPEDRPALLIEPTPDFATLFATHYRLGRPASIQLLTGDFGLLQSGIPPPIRDIVVNHDLASLLVQLFRALAPLLARYPECRLYAAGTDDYHRSFLQAVIQYLALLPQILQFHAQCAPLGHQLRTGPRTDHLLVIGLPEDIGTVPLITRHLGHPTSHVPLCTPQHVDPQPFLFPDGTTLTPLDHPTLHAASVSALRLLHALAVTRARWVICQNLIIFPSEDFLLLLGPLFAATGTTLLAGMTDWFTQMGRNFCDLLLVQPAMALLPAEQMHVCTMYPGYSRYYSPPDRPLSLLPFGYLAGTPALQSPHTDRAACRADLLIAHMGKKRHPLDDAIQEWFDGLDAIATRYPALLRNQCAHRLLLALHQTAGSLPPPLGTYACQQLLHELDFNYYTESRRQAVCAIVPLLARQFRVRVIGSGWDQELDPQLCEPAIADRTTLNRAYHDAGITIFFSSHYEGGVPPPEACHCLANGGYPFISAPTINPDTASSPWPGLQPGDLPVFTHLAHLPAQIAAILDDWPARNHHIATVQQRWADTLLQTGQFTIPELLANPLPNDTIPMTVITGDATIDAALLTTSLGYLALFMGFPQHALKLWQHEQSLAQLNIAAWNNRATLIEQTLSK